MITMNNVLENDYYIFNFSYSVLTDQQSQIQATNKCIRTIIQLSLLLLNWMNANSSIHVMCLLP